MYTLTVVTVLLHHTSTAAHGVSGLYPDITGANINVVCSMLCYHSLLLTLTRWAFKLLNIFPYRPSSVYGLSV